EEEARVPVGAIADELVVDEHLRAAEDTLQLEHDGALAPHVRHLELAQIGEGPAGVVRGGSTGRHVGAALDVAQRVVWEPDPLGGGFAIDCGKRAARAAYAPAIGEGYAHHGRLLMLSGTGYLTLLMPMIEIAPRIDIAMA